MFGLPQEPMRFIHVLRSTFELLKEPEGLYLRVKQVRIRLCWLINV